jgi:hypothetical protein
MMAALPTAARVRYISRTSKRTSDAESPLVTEGASLRGALLFGAVVSFLSDDMNREAGDAEREQVHSARSRISIGFDKHARPGDNDHTRCLVDLWLLTLRLEALFGRSREGR